MTDTVKLKEKIADSGISVTFISSKLGISREGLYKKLKNESEFKASEIATMQEVLRLSDAERDEIFFAK